MIHFLVVPFQLQVGDPLLPDSLFLDLELVVDAFFPLPELRLRSEPQLFLITSHVVFELVSNIQPLLVHVVVG